MTIAATRTRRLTIDNIVLTAYRVAGLVNEGQQASAAKRLAAYTLLETIVDENQIYGLYAREIVFETLLLTAGEDEYALSDDAFDVISDGMYIPANDPDPEHATAEMLVVQIDRESWQRISAKSSVSYPTQFYTDRTSDTLRVKLWPIPSEAGRIRFQVHRLTADNNDGGATPDLERFWVQFLIWELAHQLATSNSLSLERILHLQQTAAAKLLICRAYANPRGSQQAYLDHSTGWNR